MMSNNVSPRACLRVLSRYGSARSSKPPTHDGSHQTSSARVPGLAHGFGFWCMGSSMTRRSFLATYTHRGVVPNWPCRFTTTSCTNLRSSVPLLHWGNCTRQNSKAFYRRNLVLDTIRKFSARSTSRGENHDRSGDVSERKSNVNQELPTRENLARSDHLQESPTAQQHHTRTVDHLRDHLPNLAQYHRPSREELLAAATGFWSRLKIRFKWLTIRSTRPFNIDEIGAFFSWIMLGHFLWIILGTTTFFSLAILAVNTVFAQETLARWVGNYLTRSSGVKIIFESAIVPKWGDGVISFKNVFVSRRPGLGAGHASKGFPSTEAAAAVAAARSEREPFVATDKQAQEEDSNYTQFDLTIDTVNVTLSFRKWLNSKGLLGDVEVKGVRGVVDRTSVHYTGEYIDPRTFKHEHSPGDFEIDSFRMQDLLVTVHQPNQFRPFSVAVFACDLPQLRRQWLFYDFLSANTISGTVDNSIFNLHPRQDHSIVRSPVEGGQRPCQKSSRLRIDALNIDHLNRGIEGPLSWIHEGNVDIVADITFPDDADESISKLMSDIYDRVEATVSTESRQRKSKKEDASYEDSITLKGEQTARSAQEDTGLLVMDVRAHLNDIRAAVPLFTKDLSYVNNALVRPIVAYLNSRKAFVPVHCRVVKHTNEFDGSWTIFDSGLMDDLSAETYQAFANDVKNDQARLRRFKKVGLWSFQLAMQAFFMGLAGNFV